MSAHPKAVGRALTSREIQMAAEYLSEYGSLLLDRSCNDVAFDNTEEMRKICRDACASSGDPDFEFNEPEPGAETFIFNDWAVALHLSKLIANVGKAQLGAGE